MELQELFPSYTRITVYERHDSVAYGSPINHLCAAQMISQNVSETLINHWFQRMVGNISHFENFEDITNNTNERPHGWSRATGQWKHYRCHAREKIFLSMQQHVDDSKDGCAITFEVGKCLRSLSRKEEGLALELDSYSGSENHIYSIVVLAVPAFEAQRLVRTLPNTIVPTVALEVLDRCSKNYHPIYCNTVRVKYSSDLGRQLKAKFYGQEVRQDNNVPMEMEFNVSAVVGDITLLSLDTADNDSHMVIHVHARSEQALSRDYLTSWFSTWLSPTDGSTNATTINAVVKEDREDEDEDIDSGMVRCFAQSRGTVAPLSPMRECGCLVLPLSESATSSSLSGTPLLVLCGDWAVGGCGTMSGALLSAHKTAVAIANYFKTES